MCFAFYAEIQNGHQKWHENDFWQTVTDDSDYLGKTQHILHKAFILWVIIQ